MITFIAKRWAGITMKLLNDIAPFSKWYNMHYPMSKINSWVTKYL